MKNEGQKFFLVEGILEENKQWSPLPNPKNSVCTVNTIHPLLLCHFHFFFGYSSTYLVNVLQLVNNLADHRFRALHFQLMEVELVLHSIPRRLLAVSAKVKVKRRFVTRECEAK